MTKRFFTIPALAVLALAYAPQMHATVADELVLDDGVGDVATVAVDTLCKITCSGACGTLLYSTVFTGAHQEINVQGHLGQFNINATAYGGGDSQLPTLQDLNQINATSTGAGKLTSTFTDTDYTDMNPILNIADSNVSDQQIASSTVTFAAFTDGGNAIPAGTQVYTNTLTGESDSNGAGGALATNPNSPDGSLTSQTVLNFTGDGKIQANISIANVLVPEPASIVLLGSLVLGLAGFARKAQSKRT